MTKQLVSSSTAPPPSGAYSQALKAGDHVFVAGQGPLHPQTREIQGTTTEEQTRHALNNVKALLEAAGATLDDVVKVNAYLARLEDFKSYDAAYESYFNEPKPVRTTIGCALVGILVEIDCIAYVGDT